MKDNIDETQTEQELDISGAWNEGMKAWNNPSIPFVISVKNQNERDNLGKIGEALSGQLAFMKYPEFQTYQNLEKILEEFSENPQRALTAINKHEIIHRFCPYDVITSILLSFEISKVLKGKDIPDNRVGEVLNLFSDMNGNTNLVRRGDEDIPWLYRIISKNNLEGSSLGRVYARSMELVWEKNLLENVKLSEREETAAQKISKIYSTDYFNKSRWRSNANRYASIVAEFLNEPSNQDKNNDKSGQSSQSSNRGDSNSSGKGKSKGLLKKIKEKLFGKDENQSSDEDENGASKEDKKDGSKGHKSGKPKKQIIYGPDDISSNIPKSVDDKTAAEIAKRLAEIGTNGMPTNPSGLKDYKDLMAGFGRGDAKKASLNFYKMLAKSYDVVFSTQPFGRPRVNPFQPIKWNPGMPVEKLDADYSYSTGGRLIPGVTTYSWNSRKKDIKGGIEEVVPNVDIYLDSSGSMPDPTESISLSVLASIVLSNKAHRKGAKVRGTNFSGDGQSSTKDSSNSLDAVLENFMIHYNGGTVLPTKRLLEGEQKHVVIITDTYLANKEATAEAIMELIRKNKRNKVTIYATSPQIDKEYLEEAGARVVQDTSTNIFKKVIGDANEVYGR